MSLLGTPRPFDPKALEFLRFVTRDIDKNHSLAEITRKTRLSPAAIRGVVQRLKKSGYRFRVHARDGIRLLERPDVLTPENILSGLETRWMGQTLYGFKRTGSTNEVAMTLARNGATEGTAVVSEAQTEGRGRLGRSWVTTPGKSLAMSLILRPRIPADEFPLLTLAAAVAVAQTLAEGGRAAEIKWPNDVMLSGRKVCGILAEMQAEQDRMAFAVIGIGVNLNQTTEDFPDSLRPRVTSVRIYGGKECPRVPFLRGLLKNMEDVYEWVRRRESARVLEAWRLYSKMQGQHVRVTQVNRTFFAQVSHVDEKGGLWVRNDLGIVERLTAGNVEVLRLRTHPQVRRLSRKRR